MHDPTDGAPVPEWQPPAGWGAPDPVPAAPPAAGGYGPAGYGPPPGQQQWGAWRPPEPKPGVIPLRPLALGEILDGAVQVVRRYPRATLGLSAVIAAVFTVLNAVVLVVALEPLASVESGTVESFDDLDAEIGGAVAGTIATAVLQGLAMVVLAGVLTAVIGKAVLGQPVALRDAWDAVRPLVPRLLGLAVVVGLAVFGVFGIGTAVAVGAVAALGAAGALLAIPVFFASAAAAAWVYVRWALAPSVVVLEKARLGESLRRSGVLVQRSWWRCFGILLLAFVIAQVVGSVLSVPFSIGGAGLDAFSGDTGGTRGIVLSSIGGGLATALVAPFETGVRALLYVDRRMRAEGLDVALQASAAAQPPA